MYSAGAAEMLDADTPVSYFVDRTAHFAAAADEALPPDAERLFATRMGATTVEIPSSHVAMVSHPGEVAKLIETAAEAVLAAS